MKKSISVSINKKIKKFNKTLKVSADKSISLRALMLASQCIGVSKIKNLLESEDVFNCLKVLKTLGIKIVKNNNVYSVYGNGLNSFKSKKKINKNICRKQRYHSKTSLRSAFNSCWKILFIWRQFYE